MEINLKDKIRKNILKERNNMKIENVYEYSNKIIETIMNFPKFIESKNIMIYLSFNKEVDTYPLAEWCLSNGKNVILPYCVHSSREIIPYKVDNLTNDLSKSSFGIMEPKHEILESFSIKDIDLIIVPGVAFDEKCNRIGFGVGYYDRFLPKKVVSTPTTGIAYDYQVIDEIPIGVYDVPLDFIITEKRIITKLN